MWILDTIGWSLRTTRMQIEITVSSTRKTWWKESGKHGRTKHIDIKRKWLDDKLQPPDAQFVVKRVDTSENVVDLFTKSLPRTTFEKHASSVFLCWYY